MAIKAVVFDFGGVLIDWSPEYLYRQLIPDETERRWFLTTSVRWTGWSVRTAASRSSRQQTNWSRSFPITQR